MKSKALAAALFIAIATGSFLFGSAVNGRKATVSETTAKNLSTAMHGEAFAYAKYMLYAEHARQHGNEELAKVFESFAKTERFEHFAEEAKIAGLVGDDSDNLKDAISGESYEVQTMYREFAEQAQAAGDKEAAERFEEIRADEVKHRDAFQAELAKLQKTSTSGTPSGK